MHINQTPDVCHHEPPDAADHVGPLRFDTERERKKERIAFVSIEHETFCSDGQMFQAVYVHALRSQFQCCLFKFSSMILLRANRPVGRHAGDDKNALGTVSAPNQGFHVVQKAPIRGSILQYTSLPDSRDPVHPVNTATVACVCRCSRAYLNGASCLAFAQPCPRRGW